MHASLAFCAEYTAQNKKNPHTKLKHQTQTCLPNKTETVKKNRFVKLHILYLNLIQMGNINRANVDLKIVLIAVFKIYIR